MLIDNISYRTTLKYINPLLKTFFTFFVLTLLLITDKKEIFILNFVVSNVIMLFFIKVKIKELLKLYSIPTYFILCTVLSLILIKGDYIIFILRSFSSISVIYVLVCSTPIIDLDYVFYKLKFPKIFRELFLLIYKYIFILFEIKEKLENSQKSRLGNLNYKSKKDSFVMLVVALFKKLGYYSLNSTRAVESRLGTEFIFIHKKYKKIGIELIFFIGIVTINLLLVVINYA